MMRKLFSALIIVITFSLVVSGSLTAIARVDPTQEFLDKQRRNPETNQWFIKPAMEEFQDTEIVLGEPGTSFRYLKTVGVTEEPYLVDTDHLYGPNGLFLDASDNLYVVEQMRGMRMLKYDNLGNTQLAIGHPGYDWHHDDYLAWPTDVIVAPNGNIWVTINPALKEFDQSGQLVQIFPSVDPWMSGTDNNRFDDPRGLAFDSLGLMYVADTNNHRIQIYDISSGTPVYSSTLGITGSPGTSTDGKFNLPNQLAFDSLGRLYVTERGNHDIQRCVNTIGNWMCTTFFGEPGVTGDDLDHLHSPWGITIREEQIFIADFNNARVLKCDTSAVCTLFAGETDIWGSDNEHFYGVADVAVDSIGNVYISDRSNQRIQKYNSSGNYLETIGETRVPYLTTGTYFNHPVGVTVDPDGNLFVLEHWGNRMVKVDSSGTVEWTYGSAGVYGEGDDLFSSYWGLPEGKPAVDANGLIYVTDSSKHRVLVINPDGTFNTKLGDDYVPGNGQYQFDYPTGVAISPVNGDIYVVDRWNNRIQVFTKDRVYKASLGIVDECGTSNQHFCGPWDVTIDQNGNIFVADTENLRVQKCTLNAPLYSCTTFAGETGVFATDFGHLRPLGIAVDFEGNVYVADEWDNQRIQVYNPTGAYLTTIGGTWNFLNGGFNNPKSVAVDAEGNVYVADELGMRIQIFAPGYPGWIQTNINGFGNRNIRAIPAMGIFDNYLFASATEWDVVGNTIYRSTDGKTWEKGNTDFSTGVSALQGFGDYIYAGTWGNKIYRSANGLDWDQVYEAIGGISHFSVFDGVLYAGVYTDPLVEGTTIYKTTDGLTWEPFVTNGNGTQTVSGVISSATFKGLHYFGAADWNDATGAHIWRTDGISISEVVDDGFGDPINRAPGGMAVFGDYLYVSIGLDDGYEVWRSSSGNKDSWENILEGDPSEPGNTHQTGMATLGNTLYLFVQNDETGLQVWTTINGVDWFKTVPDGFGDSNNIRTEWGNSLAVFHNQLYLGIVNPANGAEIWKTMSEIYLPMLLKN